MPPRRVTSDSPPTAGSLDSGASCGASATSMSLELAPTPRRAAQVRGFASVGVPLLDFASDVPSSFLRQVCDYRKDAAVIVGCGAEAQLDKDGANMRLHGLF